MVKRSPHFSKLQGSYLFPEIQKRKQAFLQANPEAELINLGIGDTTQPITPFITQRLIEAAKSLGTPQGYSGYGTEQGNPELRKKISEKLYAKRISPDEISLSDGAKCDIGRLQLLFGQDTTIAVQDPTYPVYVDTSILCGKPPNIIYMPCTPENDFFPDLETVPRTDLIYFCSPNNPTGSVATRTQLQDLVDFARRNRSLIIFDSAYACFIQDPHLPRSIYEIDGARDVAIEVGSFSKMAGFTGIRLGWCVVPKELQFDDGTSLPQDWLRIVSTFFNGASNIAQHGGIAALEDQGMQEIQQTIDYYLQNVGIIKQTFENVDLPTYGGNHSPYVWVDFSPKKSWEAFDELLENTNIVSIPGCGFGPSGEGFLRFSAFGHRNDVEKFKRRLHEYFPERILSTKQK